MTDQPVIDVVIVNHNSGPALQRCVIGLLAAEPVQLKVVVIDNASYDESLEGLAESAEVSIIRNTTNTGFAKACNQGLAQGSAECVVFLNPDCFATAEDLRQLRQQLMAHSAAAMFGCRVLNEDGSLQAASRRRLPTFWRILFHQTGLSRLPAVRGINIHDSGRFAGPIVVEAINGALMVCRRSDIEAVGGFDEHYPLHFEDLDLFARLQQQNKHLMYDSTIEVTHLKGHSKQDSENIKSWKRQGLKRYMQAHRPAWEARLVSWLIGSK